jgi:hypothetical protein
MEAIEEIREAVWQRNKPEEMALIKEIEQAQRILAQLQQKYRDFETRVTKDVDTELAKVSPVVHIQEPVIQIKVKSKCSICKGTGHNKKSCTSSSIP